MHPIAIQFGSVVVHWYGVLVACGFLAGIWMTVWRARRENIPVELIFDLSLYLLIFGMLGGKLFYLIAYWPDFMRDFHREGFNALRSGFVFYGGFICAVIVTIHYARRHGIAHWRMADLFTPALPLGHAFGRLGCFMEGCCYGDRCDLSWAAHFPANHPTYPYGVYPTQFMEAAANLLFCAFLSWFYPRRKFDGQVFWIYAILYAVMRFSIEFIRGDNPRQWPGHLTNSQVTAILWLVAAAVFLWKLPKKRIAA